MTLIGQTIGRYHILEQLGEGGMATVYKAHDLNLERDVAVKVIRTDIFGSAILERMLKRFRREGRALGKLAHPNIVPILDFGDYNGAPYIVMPYLPGGTLKQRLRGQLPYRQAVQMLIPIAQALVHAHQQGIIHRDVKPANILLTRTGELMLSDFGIARIIDAEETRDLTSAGVGIGTPEYMAPEQGMGQADERSDIYALGIVLYEMVTGRIPFRANTPMAILLKKNQDALPRPTQFVSDLPQAVENVLIKALARKPDDRYQSVEELLYAMESLLGGVAKADKLKSESVKQQSSRPREKTHDTLATMDQPDTKATIDQNEVTTVDDTPGNQKPNTEKAIRPTQTSVIKYWPVAVGAGGLALLVICGFGLFAVSNMSASSAPSNPIPTTFIQSAATKIPTSKSSYIAPTSPPSVVVIPSATFDITPAVIASRTTPSEMNSIASIWKATGIGNPGDIPAPGTKHFNATVNSSDILLWLFFWCTSNQQTLDQNMKYVTVDMLIDNVSLSSSQIYEIDDSTSNGKWRCHNWYTTLRNWKREANIQLTIHYSFSRKINDGYTNYPAGDYYIQLNTTVR